MKLAVLGSGSRGNAVLLRSDSTAILIDAGFSGRQIERRLAAVGQDPTGIEAIVVTHDHSDHTRGIGVYARRHGTPLYMTDSTKTACAALLSGSEGVSPYRAGRPFRIGDLVVEPFITAHDAVDPVAVAVTGEACGTRIGIATDMGRPTAGAMHALSGCDFLVLEANHDEDLLRRGPYPRSVQARIASTHGHLSNRAAAELARRLLHPRLSGILLAHLSMECNRPELAERTVRRSLSRAGWKGFLGVAAQDEPTRMIDVRALRAEREADQLSFF